MKLKHFHKSADQPDDSEFVKITRRELNQCVNEWVHWHMAEFVVVAVGSRASRKEYNLVTRNETMRLKWLDFMGRSFSARERESDVDYSLADEIAIQCRGLAWAIRKAAAGTTVYVYPEPVDLMSYPDECYFAIQA